MALVGPPWLVILLFVVERGFGQVGRQGGGERFVVLLDDNAGGKPDQGDGLWGKDPRPEDGAPADLAVDPPWPVGGWAGLCPVNRPGTQRSRADPCSALCQAAPQPWAAALPARSASMEAPSAVAECSS